MKKTIIIYSFILTGCMFNLLECIGQPHHVDFNNYITISNGEFKDGNSVFKPLCINYLINYARYNILGEKYFIAPLFHYSAIKRSDFTIQLNGIDYHEHWGYADNRFDEKDSIKHKLEHDLKVIDSLGFNVVRLPPAIYWENDTLRIPTGSYSDYFRLTDSLIAKCAANNLRVIMVLSDDPNTYKQFDQYCVYLDSVTRHYSTNKTVMAYVIYMEPSYKWKNAHINDKIMISNWARKWYYLVKRNAPHQLVTYGLDGLSNIFIWDPSALTCDFLSMHFYYLSDDPIVSATGVASSFKWMHDNVNEVWVLGETGFCGTGVGDTCLANPKVGTAAAQRQYADSTMQKSLDCGCKGYAWWQYQEAMWDSCSSKHFGIVTFYPNENLKEVASLFPAFSSRTVGNSCLSIPIGYYNMQGYDHLNISGLVKDNYGNPIKDAIVKAWTAGYHTQYSTFTDSQGNYHLYTPDDTVLCHLWISQKGYDVYSQDFYTPPTDPIILTRINYNRWKKNWSNHNFPISSDNFIVTNSDNVIVGNFYGDEAQELIVILPLTQTASLYSFHTNHWEQVWTGVIGDWQISFTDNFYASDYNGDGYDELLCVQNATSSWSNIYHFNTQYPDSPWQSIWTNSGNGKIGNWTYCPGDIILCGHFNDFTHCSLLCIRNFPRLLGICQQMTSSGWENIWSHSLFSTSPVGFNKYYVGDFNSDGIDEIFCVQVSNGTSDQMTLMQYSTFWNILWTNNGQSEGLGIYPYRNFLHVGNFDQDKADELLGVGTWATKFDFNTSNQWNWSWSTYELGKLSDWSINPNHIIFFMKVMSNVPDYLFVASGIPKIDYKFEAYSFDP